MNTKAISQYGLSVIALSLLSACGSSDNSAVNNNTLTPVNNTVASSNLETIPKVPLKNTQVDDNNNANDTKSTNNQVTNTQVTSTQVNNTQVETTQSTNNQVTVTQTEDTQAPSLTLRGANPQQITLGGNLVNLGAVAYDTVDGDLSAAITTDNNVNTSVAGCYLQTYLVSDNAGNSKSATRRVFVGTSAQRHSPNTPPTTREVSLTSTNVKTTTINLLGYANDEDCDSLKVTNISQPSAGTSITQNANGSITFNPQGKVGSHSFDYTVSDNFGGSSTSGVTIASIDPNDGNDNWPVITGETIRVSKNQSILIKVLDNDYDDDGDVLVLDAVDDPAHGSVQKINGDVLYTPDANYVGTDSFYYGVHDNHGHNGSGLVNITISD